MLGGYIVDDLKERDSTSWSEKGEFSESYFFKTNLPYRPISTSDR